ncbi:NAD-dependent protein deacylase [Liquorilactobacillus uvarum]|uniref:NAD-dependent protein deacylase n=1 Tax=Liquorilactobacillus uvarum TaxID=303240 RepID=UPI002889AF68|nr:NAD-dependent protein deacylase [Liquorilactobacillus uvarum]
MIDLQRMLDDARNIVFLTGAGVSTPSGIPDYRSKSGLYAQTSNPEYLLSKTCLRSEPSTFYNFVMKQMYYPEAQPNVIHKKIAAASHIYHAKVITQNVDGLHASAGSDDVLEFHGNLYHVYCQKCGESVNYRDYLKSMIHQKCGGILRPDIVLYEEAIDQKLLQKAINILAGADLIIICGTSLLVYPFAGLIQYRSSKAKIVAINREKIALPPDGKMILEDAALVFSNLNI